ncbi:MULTISPECIES: hypothetical protein [unclassified Caldicellulosiruptor]|nr:MULTISPECIES: hypothetical protein [unclassified Caldicellulosiruptor]
MKKLYDTLHQAGGIVDYVSAQTKLVLDRLFALMKISEGCQGYYCKKWVK